MDKDNLGKENDRRNTKKNKKNRKNHTKCYPDAVQVQKKIKKEQDNQIKCHAGYCSSTKEDLKGTG